MKTKLLTLLGLLLLLTLDLAAATEGLSQVTTSATSLKDTLFTLAKIIASINIYHI